MGTGATSDLGALSLGGTGTNSGEVGPGVTIG
jgi:hypothetical protein